MIKKILLFFFLSLALTNCASVNEFAERAKGDGIPYIPGI